MTLPKARRYGSEEAQDSFEADRALTPNPVDPHMLPVHPLGERATSMLAGKLSDWAYLTSPPLT